MKRALLLVICSLLPLGAQTPAPRPASPVAGPRAEKIAQELGLSQEQRQKLQAIRERKRAEFQAKAPELKAAHLALRQAMQDPKTTDTELRKRFNEASELRFQMLLAGRRSREEMRALLTPEQQAKAQQMRDQFRTRVRVRMREHLQRRLQGMDELP